MAPNRDNRRLPLEEKAASESSSSEEEESEEGEEEEEEEEDEDEESEEDKSTPLPPTPSVDKKPSSTLKKPDSLPLTPGGHGPQSSSSVSGSESDSDSDSSPDKPRRPSSIADPNVKPIASKPMEDPPKTKRPRSKLGASALASSTPSKPSAAPKRPMDIDNDGKDSKRIKKKASDVDADGVAEDDAEKKSGSGGGTDDTKKQLFQRLWSEDDEIAILKGMVEYTSKKGADPSADMNAFHDFIKKSLHVDVTRTQLVDKVRRLKKKFENNLGKGKKGEDRTFSKPHEQKAFELSKKVWSSEVNSVGGVDQSKVNGKARRNQKVNKAAASPKAELLDATEEARKAVLERDSGPSRCLSGSIEFNRIMGVPGLEEGIIKEGIDLIEKAKKLELEEKWRKVRVAEIEVYLKRVELIREQTILILDALKPSGH